MSTLVATADRLTGKLSDQPLLFQYTIKLVLLVAFLELILYRLVSRLGMHLSKLAADHQWIIPTFTALTEIGQWLLNAVAILLFLGLGVGMINRLGSRGWTGLNRLIIPCISLLLLLTIGFLFVPPTMLGSAIYNTVALCSVVLLMSEYLSMHHDRAQRLLGVTYLLGISGWLYYQIVSTFYSFSGSVAAPPLVYEAHRGGEALMVLASILVFWAYGRGVSFRSRNQRQRTRAIWFWGSAGVIFSALFFLDFLLNRYDPALATNIRKGADGIGWIFQFGMGYTFYLPFALYMAGLICWSYTVIKLLTMGRLAGYGLGLMFIAGYALLYSNLTLMVVLGVMLLTMDRYRRHVLNSVSARQTPVVGTPESLVGGHV
ncbi:conserved membrane protein of unknown function [Nitrospira sp. KM1]|uniref:hypothetical protein n=1 Tax=Nitrospira sp. KM1 TaxID=1936990 RepID=UPI0013A74691|nr:hypothetical protein [Nitrospira sp. KM1]BCA54339.1 conserved membrane protein of unknown function [Nitrospira sp. KM1]